MPTITTQPCQLQPGVMCEVKAPRDVNLMDQFLQARIDVNPAYAVVFCITAAVAVILAVGWFKSRGDRLALADDKDAYAKRRAASDSTIRVGMSVGS